MIRRHPGEGRGRRADVLILSGCLVVVVVAEVAPARGVGHEVALGVLHHQHAVVAVHVGILWRVDGASFAATVGQGGQAYLMGRRSRGLPRDLPAEGVVALAAGENLLRRSL